MGPNHRYYYNIPAISGPRQPGNFQNLEAPTSYIKSLSYHSIQRVTFPDPLGFLDFEYLNRENNL